MLVTIECYVSEDKGLPIKLQLLKINQSYRIVSYRDVIIFISTIG